MITPLNVQFYQNGWLVDERHIDANTLLEHLRNQEKEDLYDFLLAVLKDESFSIQERYAE